MWMGDYMRGINAHDKDNGLRRLGETLMIYKLQPTSIHKMDAIAAFVAVQALADPEGFSHRTVQGMRRRHEVRDELHTLEKDAFLRRLSELLHKEG